MNTASQQSLGGSVAGITGEANLQAARTRNAGGYQGAIASGSRAAQQQLSENALLIQGANAQLKEKQRQQALSAIQQLYGTTSDEALKYLQASTGALTAENASHPVQEGFRTGADVLAALTGASQTGANIEKQATGCWIAAAVYDGWDDPRTIDVRRWLNGEFKKTAFGKAIMTVYLAIGQQVAWGVRRSPLLKRVFRPLFDLALARARG